jgi:hypothetical protein
MQRVILIVGAVALVACAKSSTAPATANVTGSWSGPISDAILGNGTISITLTEAKSDSVVGTWATIYQNPADDLSGNVEGHVSGATLSVVLKAINPTTCQFGPIDLTATVLGTTSMSGTFVTVPCAVSDSGSFTMIRQ